MAGSNSFYIAIHEVKGRQPLGSYQWANTWAYLLLADERTVIGFGDSLMDDKRLQSNSFTIK